MGSVNLIDVPGFRRLYRCVKNGRFDIVFVDLDETGEGLTPDHESGFVRSLLENAGAKVFNAFSDDGNVFKSALKARCGDSARDYEVTDGTDIVCFFRLSLAISLLHRFEGYFRILKPCNLDIPIRLIGELMLLSHCALTPEVRARSSKIA
jgi:hypothetical protein